MGSISKPHLLLVEGQEEVHFFNALIKYMKINDIHIETYEGKDKLGSFLEGLVKMSDFKQNKVVSIGIERDANSRPESALQSVQGALKNYNLPVPRKVLIPFGKEPMVTVMIVPGITKPGMLEDLCLESAEKDPAMKCVNDYFKCLKKRNIDLPPKNKMSKAKVHTFLASRKDPELELGVAALRKYWNFDSKAFNDIKKFIKLVACQNK